MPFFLFEEYSFALSRGQVEHIFFRLLFFLSSLSLLHVKRMDLLGSVLSGHSLLLFISVNIWCQCLLLYKVSPKKSLSGEMELLYTPFLNLFLAASLRIFLLFLLLREPQDLTVFSSSDYLWLSPARTMYPAMSGNFAIVSLELCFCPFDILLFSLNRSNLTVCS